MTVPNKIIEDQKIPQYATYVENRKPQFKTHTNRGHAYNSINNHYKSSDCGIYEFIDGNWTLIEEVPMARCSECNLTRFDRYEYHSNGAFARTYTSNRYFYYIYSSWKNKDKWQVPVYKNILICNVCKHKRDELAKSSDLSE